MTTAELTKHEAGTALTLRPGEGGHLSGLDKQLLEMASKRFTPEQMSDALNGALEPARCGQRVKEILKSKNYLDPMEQVGLLMLDMVRLKDFLFQQVEADGGVSTTRSGKVIYTYGDPRWSANLIRLLKEFREMTEKLLDRTEATKESIYEGQAKIMLAGIEAAFGRFTFALSQKHGIPEAELRELMEDALTAAWEPIQARVVDE